MTSSELLFASVAVIDGDEKSALDAGGNAIHELLRCKRRFDAFVQLGMDRVAVEEFQFLGRRLAQVSMKRPSLVSTRKEPFALRISTGRASKNSLAKTIVSAEDASFGR